MLLHGVLAWGLLSTMTISTWNTQDGNNLACLDFCLLPPAEEVVTESSPPPPQPRKVVKKQQIAKAEARKEKTVVAEKQPAAVQAAPEPPAQLMTAKEAVEPEKAPPTTVAEAEESTETAEAAQIHASARQAAQRQQYVDTYLAEICQKIQQNMRYPKLARRMGLEGKVVVSFVVHKDGNVADVHIKHSSGVQTLDKNAIVTIKKAAPFPRPPIKAKLIVPIKYGLV